MEEEKKTTKKIAINPILLIVIAIVLIVIGLVLGKVLFGEKQEEKDKNNNEKTEQKETIDTNEISSETKDFLNDFTNAAMYGDSMGDGIPERFIYGNDSLTLKDKLTITYNSLVKIKAKHQKVTEVPEKYKNDDYWNVDSEIWQLSLSEFKAEYQRLFKEDVDISSLNDFGGCPFPFKIDEELGYIYLSDQCGGTGAPHYYNKIFNYVKDNDYYYVYQYVGTKRYTDNGVVYANPVNGQVLDFEFNGNEDKFGTLIWKFDSNLKYISVESK